MRGFFGLLICSTSSKGMCVHSVGIASSQKNNVMYVGKMQQ
jgi:hypothetical protein